MAKSSQRAIDLLDGKNLHVLGEVIHLFDAAYDLDPSVPAAP